MADHIRQMADLMHADAIQQLEVALLGLPAAEVMDLLSSGLSQFLPWQQSSLSLMSKFQQL